MPNFHYYLSSNTMPSFIHSFMSPQDTQVCGQPVNNALLVPRTSLKFDEQAFSVAGPAVGTASQQTFGQPAALQLSRRSSRLFCFIDFMTLQYLHLISSCLLVGWSAASVSLYCQLHLHLHVCIINKRLMCTFLHVKYSNFADLENGTVSVTKISKLEL